MKSTKLLLYTIVFCLFCYTANAQYQNRPFRTIDNSHGLSQNSVFKIFQDSQGFMWLGTMNGLNRYDGYSFSIYQKEVHNPNSLPDNWVIQIDEDKYGNLWLGTHDGGLSRFDPKTNQFLNLSSLDSLPKTIRSSNIWGLHIDKAGMVWIGGSNGLERINPATLKIANLNGLDSLKKDIGKRSINVVVERKNKFYLGSWGKGLYIFDPATGNFERFTTSDNPNSISNNRIKEIIQYNDSILYIGTQKGGLCSFNCNTKTFTRIKTPLLQNTFVQSISKDKNGFLWLGTQRNGLIHYQPQIQTAEQYNYLPNFDFALQSDWIPDTYIDKSGLLWVGSDVGVSTATSGNSGFSNFPFDMLSVEQKEYEVRALHSLDDNILLGTIGGGLHEFSPAKNKLVNLHKSIIDKNLASPRVWTMVRDSEGDFWFGTGRGLLRYNPTTKKSKNYYRNPTESPWITHSNISALWTYKDEIWVGTWNGGFSIYNFKTGNYEIHKNSEKRGSLSSNYINKFYRDSQDRIWIATNGGGLNLFDRKKNKFKAYRYKEEDSNSISSDNVEDILEGSNGNIWVATNGGGISILDVEKDSFIKLTQKNGLSDNTILQIFSLNDTIIWAASANGLNRINTITSRIDILTRQNGLLNNQFSKGRVVNKDGTFWLSTGNGLVHISPQTITTQDFSPSLAFTEFKRFNKEENLSQLLKEDSTLHLEYNDYVISFAFSALDYRSSEKNRYSYILEGFDDNWVQLENQNKISFPTLPDGKYTLKVKGTNSEGKWGKELLQLKIVVSPPFYKTHTFYIIIAILLSISVYFVVLWRTRNLEQTQKILQERVTIRTRELEKEKQKVIDYSQEVERQRDHVTEQSSLIRQQNKKLTSSIVYAKRIQTGLLPENEFLNKFFNDSFLYFAPRDIVSGDFYWYTQKGNSLYITVADCTGHGVPGAFMSVLGISNLAEILNAQEVLSTDKVLAQLRTKIISELSKDGNKVSLREGMDMALLRIDLNTKELEFSGAHNPLYIVRKDASILQNASRQFTDENNVSLFEYKGDRMPIGKQEGFAEKSFTKKTIQLKKGDRIYLLTDGYADQFEVFGKYKYTSKRLKANLLHVQNLSMSEQHNYLLEEHSKWRGQSKQIDDMLIMGVEV